MGRLLKVILGVGFGIAVPNLVGTANATSCKCKAEYIELEFESIQLVSGEGDLETEAVLWDGEDVFMWTSADIDETVVAYHVVDMEIHYSEEDYDYSNMKMVAQTLEEGY